MKDIDGFEFPDLSHYYDDDPVFKFFNENGCEAVPLFIARTRGRMYTQTLWQIADRLEEALEAALKDGPVDGIWFYTYALSAVDNIGDGEEFLLKKIRNRIGYEIPIAVAMDFHGLLTPNIASMVNIVCTFRTNPHTDVSDTRLRAARVLTQAMERGTPHLLTLRLPMLGVDSTRMDVGAGEQVIKCLNDLESFPGVAGAAFVTGIIWNNVPEGASYLTASAFPGTDTDTLRERMLTAAKRIWDVRGDWVFIDKIIGIEDAFHCADAIAGRDGSGVVFLNDSGDNPTGSGVGDSAYMLKEAIDSGVTGILVAGIWAEDFLDLCVETFAKKVPETHWQEGLILLDDEVQVEGEIGAAICPGSTRIFVSAGLQALRTNAHGEVTGARLKSGNVVFLVTRHQEGVLNRTFIDSFGTDMESYRIVVLKLGYLVPDFLPYKKDCFMVRTPGVTDLDFDRIEPEMDAVIRPMYPFDEIETPELTFV